MLKVLKGEFYFFSIGAFLSLVLLLSQPQPEIPSLQTKSKEREGLLAVWLLRIPHLRKLASDQKGGTSFFRPSPFLFVFFFFPNNGIL